MECINRGQIDAVLFDDNVGSIYFVADGTMYPFMAFNGSSAGPDGNGLRDIKDMTCYAGFPISKAAESKDRDTTNLISILDYFKSNGEFPSVVEREFLPRVDLTTFQEIEDGE